MCRNLFTALDLDGSGFLEKDECRELMRGAQTEVGGKFDEDRFSDTFKTLDKSGDGKISNLEFTGFMWRWVKS